MESPLFGLRVIEIAGLAPVPFAGLIFADFGADVIVVDSIRDPVLPSPNFRRGKRSVKLNLKSVLGLNAFKTLCGNADILLDPFRPGVRFLPPPKKK